MSAAATALGVGMALGVGFALGFAASANGASQMISDRVSAGVMEHDGRGY